MEHKNKKTYSIKIEYPTLNKTYFLRKIIKNTYIIGICHTKKPKQYIDKSYTLSLINKIKNLYPLGNVSLVVNK